MKSPTSMFEWYYQRVVLLAAEGWRLVPDGNMMFVYFMKGDEMKQGESYEVHRYAIHCLRDKFFDKDVEDQRAGFQDFSI